MLIQDRTAIRVTRVIDQHVLVKFSGFEESTRFIRKFDFLQNLRHPRPDISEL